MRALVAYVELGEALGLRLKNPAPASIPGEPLCPGAMGERDRVAAGTPEGTPEAPLGGVSESMSGAGARNEDRFKILTLLRDARGAVLALDKILSRGTSKDGDVGNSAGAGGRTGGIAAVCASRKSEAPGFESNHFVYRSPAGTASHRISEMILRAVSLAGDDSLDRW